MVVIALVCAALGVGLGYAVGRGDAGGDAGSFAGEEAREVDAARGRGGVSRDPRSRGSATPRPSMIRGLIEGAEEHEPAPEEGSDARARRRDGSSPSAGVNLVEGDEPGPRSATERARELEELREAVATLQEEKKELLGDPIAAPPKVGARFGGPSVSRSVHAAIEQVGVPGGVESVDCEEHPCIVFGRLAGDEEDMEEIERSAALSEYQSDVLTLLFWATTASPEEVTSSPETGLFALAFYSFEDQAEFGEALERRLRARVMEYWNSDRPGVEASDAAGTP